MPIKLRPKQISLKYTWVNAFENSTIAKNEKVLIIDEECRIHTNAQAPLNL